MIKDIIMHEKYRAIPPGGGTLPVSIRVAVRYSQSSEVMCP